MCKIMAVDRLSLHTYVITYYSVIRRHFDKRESLNATGETLPYSLAKLAE